MKSIRQCLSILLALALLLTCVPMNVLAAEEPPVNSAQGVQVNPVSNSGMSAEGFEHGELTEIPYEDYLSHQDAALQLREVLKQRGDHIVVYIRSSEPDYNAMVKDVWNRAVAHTGDPREGDSLGRQYDAYHWYTEWNIQGGTYYYMLEIDIDYYIDAQQHAQIDPAVEEILGELPVDHSMSDYEKLKIVYDWICANVVYDYDHDATYLPRHSVWSAAVSRKTVCQGFCALLYRLLLEVGVDNRMIFGLTDAAVPHEWNIINLDGLYYNADVTWDAENGDYEWFLLGQNNFPDHHRDDRYKTAAFENAHPMSLVDYEAEPDINPNPNPGTGCGMREGDVLEAMLALQGEYYEGRPWDNSHSYRWNINNTIGYGCAGFAFRLSDAAFGHLPSRTLYPGEVTFDDLRAGDILRLYNDSHSVVVLEAHDDYIVVAEGNYNYSIHWGRTIRADEFQEDLTYVITRYPEHTFVNGTCIECGAQEEIEEPAPTPDPEPLSGKCGDDVYWSLDENGKLTLSGTGATWDFPQEYPSFYEYMDEITECVIEEGVTAIGSYCFFNCEKLQWIQIPASVRKIGTSTFAYCYDLESVDFLGDAPTIGENAFYDVVADIHYPGGNPTWNNVIGQDFGGDLYWLPYGGGESEWPLTGQCGDDVYWSLTEDGVLTIYGDGDMKSYPVDYPRWYDYREILHTVIIESGVIGIGDFAFYDCPHITAVSIADTVEYIGISAFNGCDLTELTIPNGVTEIATAAFKHNDFTSVTIPASVESIEEYAFAECDSLLEVNFLGDAPEIGEDAFDYVEATCYYPINNQTWTSEKFQDYGSYRLTWEGVGGEPAPDDAVASGYCGDNLTWVLNAEGLLTISGTGEMWDVTDQEDVNWYHVREQIQRIVIESGVTTIGDWAFCRCINMKEISMPDTLKRIGKAAFSRDAGLTQINIPSSVTEIRPSAFIYCDNITQVFVPASVQTIGRMAFAGGGVTEITVDPANPHLISVDGFVYDRAMTKLVAMPGAFAGHYTMPESIREVGDYAFAHDPHLSGVTFPAGLVSIGEYAFANCTGLTRIEVPASVDYMGEAVFFKCFALTSIAFRGSAPSTFGEFMFYEVTAQVYYPQNDSTWDRLVGNQYDGSITWIPYEAQDVEPEVPAGDVDGSGTLDADDAIYLLYHTLFGDGLYPVSGDCDYDHNGSVDADDAIYLLYHTLFGDALYPLN